MSMKVDHSMHIQNIGATCGPSRKIDVILSLQSHFLATPFALQDNIDYTFKLDIFRKISRLR